MYYIWYIIYIRYIFLVLKIVKIFQYITFFQHPKICFPLNFFPSCLFLSCVKFLLLKELRKGWESAERKYSSGSKMFVFQIPLLDWEFFLFTFHPFFFLFFLFLYFCFRPFFLFFYLSVEEKQKERKTLERKNMGINFFHGKKYWSQTSFYSLNKDLHWITFHLFQNEEREREKKKKKGRERERERFRHFKKCWNSLPSSLSLSISLSLSHPNFFLLERVNQILTVWKEMNQESLVQNFLPLLILCLMFSFGEKWRERDTKERDKRKVGLIHVWKEIFQWYLRLRERRSRGKRTEERKTSYPLRILAFDRTNL